MVRTVDGALESWENTTMIRAHKMLLGATAVALFGLNPLESDASLRFRTDGIGCMPTGLTTVNAIASSGLEILGASGARGVSCPIPTGPGLVDLGDGSGHPLATVRMRFHNPSVGELVTHLFVHDYDSADGCDCGASVKTSSGYFQRTMTFDCGSCAFEPEWAANVFIFHENDGLKIKLFSVYD